MMRRLQILCFSLFLIGCADQGVVPVAPVQSPIESHVYLVPGVVVVVFSEGTTPAEAEQFVKGLNLTFQFPPSRSPLEALVSVPVGSEDQWVTNLKTYLIVKSAGRMGISYDS